MRSRRVPDLADDGSAGRSGGSRRRDVAAAERPFSRRDAQDNRNMIIESAVHSLTGETAHLPSLHKEAVRRTGLARSTVYRHFTDQEHLARVAVGTILETMRQDARAAAEQDVSFRELLTRMLRGQASHRPASAVLKRLPLEVRRTLVGDVVATLTPALETARRRGEIRDDASPPDLVTILVMLDAAATSGPLADATTAHVHRFIDVVLDGFFVNAGGRGGGAGRGGVLG